MSKRHLGFATLTVLVVGIGGAIYWIGWATRIRLPTIDFYGSVVGEHGAPIEGAEVGISIVTHDPSAYGRSGKVKTKTATLRTDAAGRFSLENEQGLHVTVFDVRKGNLVWLVDVGEHPWFQAKRQMIGNQFFIYSPLMGPVYLPDPARPAVFTLYTKDSQVAGKIIRGGADRYADGTVVQNEPRVPVLPSVGPDAPKTILERDARNKALNELLFGSVPTPPGDASR